MATTELSAEDELRNLWKTPVRTARSRALLVGLLATAALAAVPAGASATTTSCTGKWGNAGKETLTELTADVGVSYSFSCTAPVHSFALVTSREIPLFLATASEFVVGTGAPGLIMSCEGPIPGNGSVCAGAKATDVAKAGSTIKGAVGLDVKPTNYDKNSPVPFRAWVVASDTTGTLAGPVELKQPKGYAKKYAKALKKAKKASRSR
jgi:hypothetical protein